MFYIKDVFPTVRLILTCSVSLCTRVADWIVFCSLGENMAAWYLCIKYGNVTILFCLFVDFYFFKTSQASIYL